MVFMEKTSASYLKLTEALLFMGGFCRDYIEDDIFPLLEVKSGGIFLRSTSHLLEIGLDVEVQSGTCVGVTENLLHTLDVCALGKE